MTKKEFKTRWESNKNGGGINMDDVADCAKDWGVCSSPRTKRMDKVLYSVLMVAEVTDAADYRPEEEEDA